MATWAIGDIQGCFDSLMELCRVIELDSEADRLWLAGDLVNRGPRSLEVLRWAHRIHEQYGDGALQVVLGNHDLHLLACLAGVVSARPKKDTFQAVLALPDADRSRLGNWLRRRPLVVIEGDNALVHAGLWPTWSFEEARARAREVELVLAGDAWGELLAAWRRSAGQRRRWHDALRGQERLVTLLEVFTRMRCLDRQGVLAIDYKGPLVGRPRGLEPWYANRCGDQRVFFGHWAAHGYRRGKGWVALDSGCVWGGVLTAYRIEDDELVQQAAVD